LFYDFLCLPVFHSENHHLSDKMDASLRKGKQRMRAQINSLPDVDEKMKLG